MKTFFLTKLLRVHLEDLDTEEIFSHRIYLPGWWTISAEEKITYYVSSACKCFQVLKQRV